MANSPMSPAPPTSPPPINPGSTPSVDPGRSTPANLGSTPPANPGGASPANPGVPSSPVNPGGRPPANLGSNPPTNPSGVPLANPTGTPPTNPGSTNPIASPSPANLGGMPPAITGGTSPTSPAGAPPANPGVPSSAANLGSLPPAIAGGVSPTNPAGRPPANPGLPSSPVNPGGRPPTNLGSAPPTNPSGAPLKQDESSVAQQKIMGNSISPASPTSPASSKQDEMKHASRHRDLTPPPPQLGEKLSRRFKVTDSSLPFLFAWIDTLRVGNKPPDAKTFFEELTDGKLLCRICSIFAKGAENGVNQKPVGIKKLCVANIEIALTAIWQKGASSVNMCTASDVFDKDVVKVTRCLLQAFTTLEMPRLRPQAKDMLSTINVGLKMVGRALSQSTLENPLEPGSSFVKDFRDGTLLAIIFALCGRMSAVAVKNLWGHPSNKDQMLENAVWINEQLQAARVPTFFTAKDWLSPPDPCPETLFFMLHLICKRLQITKHFWETEGHKIDVTNWQFKDNEPLKKPLRMTEFLGTHVDTTVNLDSRPGIQVAAESVQSASGSPGQIHSPVMMKQPAEQHTNRRLPISPPRIPSRDPYRSPPRSTFGGGPSRLPRSSSRSPSRSPAWCVPRVATLPFKPTRRSQSPLMIAEAGRQRCQNGIPYFQKKPFTPAGVASARYDNEEVFKRHNSSPGFAPWADEGRYPTYRTCRLPRTDVEENSPIGQFLSRVDELLSSPTSPQRTESPTVKLNPTGQIESGYRRPRSRAKLGGRGLSNSVTKSHELWNPPPGHQVGWPSNTPSNAKYPFLGNLSSSQRILLMRGVSGSIVCCDGSLCSGWIQLKALDSLVVEFYTSVTPHKLQLRVDVSCITDVKITQDPFNPAGGLFYFILFDIHGTREIKQSTWNGVQYPLDESLAVVQIAAPESAEEVRIFLSALLNITQGDIYSTAGVEEPQAEFMKVHSEDHHSDLHQEALQATSQLENEIAELQGALSKSKLAK